MTRRCSHCNDHTTGACSPLCGGGGLKLFGVRLTDESFIKKSASVGNLLHHSASVDSMKGYLSDDLNHSFTARRHPIRRKGITWSEEEHMQFLLGLQKMGRGNWRGISRNYVRSRTPTQVASHAQKYFIRQDNAIGKKKRPSLFDLVPDMETNSSMPQQSTMIQSPAPSNDDEKLMPPYQEEDINNSLPSLDLSLKLAITPFPFQLWPPNAYSFKDDGEQTPQHRIITPVQFKPEETMKELVGISQLTLGDTSGVHVAYSWL